MRSRECERWTQECVRHDSIRGRRYERVYLSHALQPRIPVLILLHQLIPSNFPPAISSLTPQHRRQRRFHARGSLIVKFAAHNAADKSLCFSESASARLSLNEPLAENCPSRWFSLPAHVQAASPMMPSAPE